MSDVTRLLHALDRGDDPSAAAGLLPLVYDELRKLAEARLASEAPDQTLEATALVHEAYLRLVGTSDPGWNGRGHFFAAAANAMRRILVERARRRARLAHGGGRRREPLDPDRLPAPTPDETLLALDAALAQLAAHDPLKARLVELRHFAGLTADQAAAALNLPPRTADRHWAYARAWLRRAMEADDPDAPGKNRDPGGATDAPTSH